MGCCIPLQIKVIKKLRAKEYKLQISSIPTIAFLLDCCEKNGFYDVLQIYDAFRFIKNNLNCGNKTAFSRLRAGFRCKRFRKLKFITN
jgi:hypothetical protein